ncbi:unnamed protein product [Bursaphelenchus xylophilus]|uniref:(pine wood nematode) hypothetical protein n=1 Tax=Bursaphelenchus xylophilus TaxID=6326 RepID=A0A1I7S919_BURXY|nr:unnamed protein product [Bursaphelenchus xylophilus]CAG9086152.1 unnamed protein product [Bursaphelenchus xylophilus]
MGLQSNSVTLRVEKKLAGKLGHRSVAKHILPDEILEAIDNFHQILVEFHSPKEAEKVISGVIKTVTKLGIMFQEQSNIENNMDCLLNMQAKLRNLFKTVQSFHQVDYSYSRTHLFDRFDEAESSLLAVVERLLSPKSSNRVKFVFEKLRNAEMMDEFFKVGGRFEPHREKLVFAVDMLVP